MSVFALARIPADLRRGGRQALWFHLFMQLAGFAVIAPVVTLSFRAVLAASGDGLVSNFDIAGFLLSPVGACVAVVMLVIGATLLFAELAGLTYIAAQALAGRTATLGGTLACLLQRLPALAVLAWRVGARLVLLAVPCVLIIAIGWFGWLNQYDVNYYLARKPPEWQWLLRMAALLGAAYALLVAWLLARWLFALPALLARPEAGASGALAESWRLTRGRLAAILGPVLAWWLLMVALLVALLWLGRLLAAAGFAWAGLDLRRVLPLVSLCVAVAVIANALGSWLAVTGHQFLVTRRHAELTGQVSRATPAAGDGGRSARQLALRAVAAVVGLAVIAAAGAWFALARSDSKDPIEVTAHRGASAVAPENTLAAFRAAIDADADWIELDVQRTRDGRILVLHDADFMRVGSDPRKVGDVMAADLATIDIGAWYGDAFRGEHPPLLDEVIALARGRCRINIELKYNTPDKSLAPAVVELLRRERFIDQVVITSLDHAALQQVERIEPRLQTGHIITAAIGNVLSSQADFLSLNAARATVLLVWRAHRAGKRVHVWTVNTPEAMLELAARGVDNIITDDPGLLARVRSQARRLEAHEILGLRLRALLGRPPRELADPDAVKPL
jgi:glycerophosphoryl diester phosphodiesterase